MPKMSRYCKAYPLSRIEEWSQWREKRLPVPSENSTDAGGETVPVRYVFLHDNYVVTLGAFNDEGVLYNDVTPEWQQFCHVSLGFQPQPDKAASKNV